MSKFADFKAFIVKDLLLYEEAVCNCLHPCQLSGSRGGRVRGGGFKPWGAKGDLLRRRDLSMRCSNDYNVAMRKEEGKRSVEHGKRIFQVPTVKPPIVQNSYSLLTLM